MRHLSFALILTGVLSRPTAPPRLLRRIRAAERLAPHAIGKVPCDRGHGSKPIPVARSQSRSRAAFRLQPARHCTGGYPLGRSVAAHSAEIGVARLGLAPEQ